MLLHFLLTTLNPAAILSELDYTVGNGGQNPQLSFCAKKKKKLSKVQLKVK